MIELYAFVKGNMVYIVAISAILQIVGTLALTLFSFGGISMHAGCNEVVSSKTVTHITIDKVWLLIARGALVVLLVGIFISGIASIIASATE